MNSLEQFLLKIFRTTVLRSHQKHSVPQQIWLFAITLFLNLSDKTFKRCDAHGTFLRTETLQSDELDLLIADSEQIHLFASVFLLLGKYKIMDWYEDCMTGSMLAHKKMPCELEITHKCLSLPFFSTRLLIWIVVSVKNLTRDPAR